MHPGYKINGRYQIIRALGEGGMANIYLAHDLILDRDVSVKLLRLDLRDDPKTKARFERESLAATELSDDHIVGIYDVGEEQGLQYMVMEYIEGTDLEDYIHDHFPIPYRQVIDIMSQILSAVENAHEHGIIHRDLKPQNVLIQANQQVKITDFGIASMTQGSLTQTNTVMGSVHYLSPEQARGGLTTNQSDIYSLGIILYELLTGKVPFEGETAVAIALQHYQDEIPSVRDFDPRIPQALENVVLKATAKSPAERYASADAMRIDLSTALSSSRSGEPKFIPHSNDRDETKVINPTDVQSASLKQATGPSEEEKPKPAKKKHRKRRWLWLIPVAVLLLILGLLLIPTKETVPDLSGMTQTEAMTALNKQHLKLGKVTKQASDTIKTSKIISSDPKAQSKVAEHSKVNIVISSGVKKVVIQNYVGQSFSQSAAALRKRGVTVVKVTKSSDDVATGKIMNQSIPAGQRVVGSKTTMTLTVSSGQKKVTIPDFTGKTLNDVQTFANSNNLKVSSTEKASSQTAGTVLSQTPTGGSSLSSGGTINVTIAKTDTKTATESVALTYVANSSDTNANLVQIYLQDSNNSLSNVYQTTTLTQDTTISLPFTLNNGATGAYKVVQDGQVVASKSNITGN